MGRSINTHQRVVCELLYKILELGLNTHICATQDGADAYINMVASRQVYVDELAQLCANTPLAPCPEIDELSRKIAMREAQLQAQAADILADLRKDLQGIKLEKSINIAYGQETSKMGASFRVSR